MLLLCACYFSFILTALHHIGGRKATRKTESTCRRCGGPRAARCRRTRIRTLARACTTLSSSTRTDPHGDHADELKRSDCVYCQLERSSKGRGARVRIIIFCCCRASARTRTRARCQQVNTASRCCCNTNAVTSTSFSCCQCPSSAHEGRRGASIVARACRQAERGKREEGMLCNQLTLSC